MKQNIPGLTVDRLCTIYRLLEDLPARGESRISSSEIGRHIGETPDTVRKDINYLGEVGKIGAGYDIVRLRAHIGTCLNLEQKRNACVVGLGRLGSAIMAFESFAQTAFKIVAAFDSNINKIETLTSSVELYPAYEITDVVRRKNIEIGVIAVPASAAQEAADKLISGGVKGILNFSPAIIQYDSSHLFVEHVDMIREFTLLSARISLSYNSIANNMKNQPETETGVSNGQSL